MPDGSLLVKEANGAGGTGGSYVAIEQEITISDYYCAGKGQETAHYKWTWDGATLAMKPAGKDTCVARRTALEELTPVG